VSSRFGLVSVAIFTLCWARATAADELSDLKAQIKVLGDKIEAIEQKQKQEEQKPQTPQTAASPPTQVTNPITGASVLPAWSSGPFSVQIYGTLLPLVTYIEGGHNTTSPPSGGASQVPASAYVHQETPSHWAMNLGSSNIGFRGAYGFNPTTRAILQIESGAQLDSGPGPNTFGSRNSWLGLQSDTYGFIFVGTNFTPYFYACCTIGILKGNSFSEPTLISNPGFNVPPVAQQPGRSGTVADATFNRRQGRSINYWTPVFEGLSARFQYSLDTGTAPVSTAPGAPTYSPTTISAAVFYDKGPVGLKVGYEQHRDYFGMAFLGGAPGATATNPSSSDNGYVATATYRFTPRLQVAAQWERLGYKSDDTIGPNVNKYSRNAFLLFGAYGFGSSSTVALRYNKALDGDCSRVNGTDCITNGLGAQAWSTIYMYNIAQNVDVWGTVYQVINKRSATYTQTDRNALPGERQSGVGVGLQVVF
jgi:predicted porin